MPNIGPGELILILVIALIFIGPGKLPDVGASIGKSLREFRKASSDVQEATKVDVSLTPTAATTPAAPVAAGVAGTAVDAPVAPDADAVAAAKATLAAAEAAGAAPADAPAESQSTSESTAATH